MVELPQPSGPTFDPSRIPDFIEPDDRSNLLRLFLDSARDTLKNLKEGLNGPQKNRTPLKQTLHGLKGAAVSVGATRLAQIAKTIELGLDDWSESEAMEALIYLEKNLSDTKIAMEPWLK